MASTTGITGFDAAAFRSAIRDTMRLGAPETSGERVTFLWKVDKTYSAVDADPAGDPYDWASAPTSTDTEPSVVSDVVAIEFATIPEGQTTPVGHFDDTKGILTILDVDYENVKTADRIQYAGRVFQLQEPVPVSLFDVTVYSWSFIEGDERT